MTELPDVPGELVLSVHTTSIAEAEVLAEYVKHWGIVEFNASCPNVYSANMLASLRAFRKIYKGRLGVKLGADLYDCIDASAAQDIGVDYICACNSLRTAVGGLSGVPLHGIALRTVEGIAASVEIPVVGGGGINRMDRLKAFIDVGATDVFIGSYTLTHGEKVLERLGFPAPVTAPEKLSDILDVVTGKPKPPWRDL
jgi:dihydroorotate dehydrogenase